MFMNAHVDKIQKNKNQPKKRNHVSQRQAKPESVLRFADNRKETVAQRKLQKVADDYSARQPQPIQKKENKTGLPDNLKSGIENLSGLSMDSVKVHYSSSNPASVQAHAYTQGTNIHVASGQEKHLPHEAWHVVQQMNGKVKPTTSVNGMAINDNPSLEHEADVMGSRALESE